MTTQTAPHPTTRPSTSYGLALFAVWAIVWVALLSSCTTMRGLQQYAAEKAGRVLECQAADSTNLELAERCLGQYARDLGTKSCKEADRWLEALPHQHELAEKPEDQ